jgi:hypothetical protein
MLDVSIAFAAQTTFQFHFIIYRTLNRLVCGAHQAVRMDCDFEAG